MDCDILIVGGGTGGCAAALAGCSLGMKVIMTEETDWIGGQLTSQAVPPDEHPWIEKFGCTRTYREYRNRVRKFYKDVLPLTPEAKANPHLNPGNGWVSFLCHEPRIGLFVLNGMLQPFIASGHLSIKLNTVPVGVDTGGDRIGDVTVLNKVDGLLQTITARYVLDATELGDLLPMSGAEYVVGAESKAETGEPSAVDGNPEPDNVQGLTWVFAMGHDPDADHTTTKPDTYDRWRAYHPECWCGPLLSFTVIHAHTGEIRQLPLFPTDPEQWFTLFSYRQIVDPSNFQPGAVPHAVTLVNWPQNDYFEGNIIDVGEPEKAQHLHDSKELSRSLLYWLQTEAPRHDGGVGYPGLYMRPEMVGTQDGFAKAPYIREARRIRSMFTVLEQHVSTATNPGRDRAEDFFDTVGVGSYRIDLHPSTNGRGTVDTSTIPFQIPLGALIPIRLKNLIPACKNIGTTHITNGCYRLHPVEWNIGEAAGALAAYCITNDKQPAEIRENNALLGDYQQTLAKLGIELKWPENVTLHPL